MVHPACFKIDTGFYDYSYQGLFVILPPTSSGGITGLIKAELDRK